MNKLTSLWFFAIGLVIFVINILTNVCKGWSNLNPFCIGSALFIHVTLLGVSGIFVLIGLGILIFGGKK